MTCDLNVDNGPRLHGFGEVVSACLVWHRDGQGRTLPQCIRCQHCHQFIRPEQVGRECPGYGRLSGSDVCHGETKHEAQMGKRPEAMGTKTESSACSGTEEAESC